MISNSIIRRAIKKNITDALNDYYITQNVDPNMKFRVHANWILQRNFLETAAALRAMDGTDEGLIHGWMIGTASFSSEDESTPTVESLFKKNAGCGSAIAETAGKRTRITETFKIWVLHEFDKGTPDSEDLDRANSESRLMDEIRVVTRWFRKNLNLGIADIDFKGHTGLQIPQVDNFNLGESIASGGKGTLTVAYYDRF